MTDLDVDPLIQGFIAAAIAAGTEILNVYAGDFSVASKADASPVTAADERAEAVILAHLARLAPNVPIVAEEQAAAGQIPATADRFFLVDPLDGTREFINRNGEFTVNIALIADGHPIAGVVYAPALGRLFVGADDSAAAAEVADGTVGPLQPIRVRQRPTEGITVVGSRSHPSPETDDYVARFTVADYRSAGSSLKFCLVAAGEADLYPRFGRTMEWDTAAGHAVLEAAGGVVRTPEGAPFVYGKRNQANDVDFANGPFVAASTAALLI